MIYLILGKAGHGKDTIAEIIKDSLGERTAVTSYAGYLKWMYTQFFNWNGVKDENARTDLQVIGTDIIRETYNEDFWVDRVIEQIEIFSGKFDNFIIPDARFINEIEKVKKRFGSNQVSVIRVVRLDYESNLTEMQAGHRSETELDNYLADATFYNDDLDELRAAVQMFLESIKGREIK